MFQTPDVHFYGDSKSTLKDSQNSAHFEDSVHTYILHITTTVSL